MKTTCPHCKKDFEVNVKEADKFGFVVNSKGSFIAASIAKAGKSGTTLISLIQACDEKFPGKNNIGRIQSVINKMKKAEQVSTEGGKVTLASVK